MKTQHTPGPLLVADSGRNTWVVFYNLPTVGDQELNQKVIAEVDNIELANLIAAAPELLEAAINLLDKAQFYIPPMGMDADTWDARKKLEQVIKKAKGE